MLTAAQGLLVAIIFALGSIRTFELAIDKRHERRLLARGGIRLPNDGLLPIVLGQLLLFLGLVVEGLLVPPTPRITLLTFVFLPLAVVALAIRHWCIITLGDRWTIHVITVTDAPLVHRGPYRFLRHPNYAAVAVEAAALALACELWFTLAAVVLVLLPALANRIRRENRALYGRPQGEAGPRQTT